MSKGLSSLPDKVRILVLGDSGCGKTALLHLICHEEVLKRNIPSTVGVNLEVKLHEYGDRPFFIEFWEVGGKPKYESTRSILYSQVSGLILVHDLTNKISYTNLKKWVIELLSKISLTSNFRWKVEDTDTENLFELELDNGATCPVLILGNKEDLIVKKESSNQAVEESGAGTVSVSALNPSAFSPGSYPYEKLNTFLNKLIHRTFFDTKSIVTMYPQSPQRRIEKKERPITQPSKWDEVKEILSDYKYE